MTFAFAGSYGSHMVLQRAPVSARIWGYGFNVGESVTVSISDGDSYEATTIEGTIKLFIAFIFHIHMHHNNIYSKP